MSKYQDIYTRFKQSGLSQKAFAKQEGISTGMVSYYLRKARKEEQKHDDFHVFKPIEITSRGDDDRSILITTSKGLQITIPI
jgi:transcriptional regulator with XRE-family HTH domain